MDYEVIEDSDYRNAIVVRRPAGSRRVVARERYPREREPYYAEPPPYYPPQAPPQYYPAPAPAPAAPVVSPFTGALRWGVLADAAAQVFTALQQPPQPPQLLGDVDTGAPTVGDLSKMVEYQRALAEHQQKQVQIRTIGAVIRAFAP